MTGAEALGLTEDQVRALPVDAARIFTYHDRRCCRDWKCGRGRVVGYEHRSAA